MPTHGDRAKGMDRPDAVAIEGLAVWPRRLVCYSPILAESCGSTFPHRHPDPPLNYRSVILSGCADRRVAQDPVKRITLPKRDREMLAGVSNSPRRWWGRRLDRRRRGGRRSTEPGVPSCVARAAPLTPLRFVPRTPLATCCRGTLLVEGHPCHQQPDGEEIWHLI